jgi:hypothetical protein
LFDVLQSSAAEVLAEEQEKRAASTLDESAAGAGEIYECSLEELRARARDCLAQAETLTGVDCEDRRECLSILAETLGDAAEPQVANAMAAQLCALLVPPPSPAESESLAAGLGALLRRLDARGIDRVLPMVVEALGDGHAALWVAPALQVAPSLDAERFESLWPHLANEALHGPRLKTSSHYPSLLAQIERLSRTCLAPAMRRLQRLDALAKGHIEKHAFRPARPALAAFYAALLGSSQGARVGVHLLAELRERPPTWLPTEFLRCVATPDAECREFLAQLLDAEDERARRAAEQRAGRALAARLLTVSHERAQEPWVVAAIEAFGARGIREAEGALRRVVDERRMSLWPAWPSEHRRAAARALERLDTTGAGST